MPVMDGVGRLAVANEVRLACHDYYGVKAGRQLCDDFAFFLAGEGACAVDATLLGGLRGDAFACFVVDGEDLTFVAFQYRDAPVVQNGLQCRTADRSCSGPENY